MESKTSLIFVHGIYHGAWCWENFTQYFGNRGYYTEAVTLLGGSRKPTLEGYLDAVEQAVETAKQAYGDPVIVVGHSKGGGLAQCFVAQRPGKADGVILIAALPLRRVGRLVPSFLWRHIASPRMAREMVGLIQVAVALTLSKPVSADIVRRCALFSSRISPAEAERYASLLAPEPYRPSFELGRCAFKPARVDVPVHVVASTGDHVFSLWGQKVLAGAYGGEVIVVSDLCHDMMLDPEWERAAEATATLVARIEQQSQSRG